MRKAFSLLVVVLVVCFSGSLLAKGPTSKVPKELKDDLDKALQPLSTLSDKQMLAVATLVRAAQYGMPVDEYCPPLRRFTGSRFPCENEMAAVSNASNDCRRHNVAEEKCVAQQTAEANLMTCEIAEFQRDIEQLQRGGGVLPQPGTRPGPQPGPQPAPVR